MNKMMTSSNKKTEFEFEYEVSCIKTYTETHTFTRSDVEMWVEDERSIFDLYDAELCLEWSHLTEEEQEAFFQYVSDHYSHSDQCEEENRQTTHDYCGEHGDDEDYEGTPDSVMEQWQVCLEGWHDEYAPKVLARVGAMPMEFVNDDGVRRTLTVDEYFAHKDYEGDDKMWLQLEEEVLGIEKHKQIWVKVPVAESDEVVALKAELKVANEVRASAEALVAKLKAEMEALYALLAKKDKQIKALVAVE